MTLTAPPVPSALPIVLATGPDYDVARRAWNLAIDQRPAAIVRPRSAQEVGAAVRLAAERGQRAAAQGTGHGAWAMGSLIDTVLVRTDRMSSVEVDPAAGVARVGAGALWRDVARAAGEHGLAALAGAPDVGVTGYTVGGGLSFLSRRFGLACNRVRAVELVTADGRLRRVDAAHEPELFWAVRGGGGNFGIVCALELELLTLTEVYAGVLWYPLERAPEVLHRWRELVDGGLPEELTTVGRILKFPPVPEVPALLRGQSFVVVEAFHAGDPRVADDVLAPLRALGPAIDTMAVVPVSELSAVHMDPDQPAPVYGDGMTLADVTPDTVQALVAAAGPHSGFPLLSVELRHLEGALGRGSPAPARWAHWTPATRCMPSPWPRAVSCWSPASTRWGWSRRRSRRGRPRRAFSTSRSRRAGRRASGRRPTPRGCAPSSPGSTRTR